MKIYLGADHRGYELKEKIAKWLFEKKYVYEDVGAQSLNVNDDYTLYASEVALLVSKNKNSLGVLACGSGVGVDATANKFDGIRAAVGKSPKQVEAGRSDDDMNILVMAADYTKESEALDMLEKFLTTKFSGKVRFKRRLEEIARIEENN